MRCHRPSVSRSCRRFECPPPGCMRCSRRSCPRHQPICGMSTACRRENTRFHLVSRLDVFHDLVILSLQSLIHPSAFPTVFSSAMCRCSLDHGPDQAGAGTARYRLRLCAFPVRVSLKDLVNVSKINGLQAVSKELYPIKSNNPKYQKFLHVRLQYSHRLSAPDHGIIRA